MSGGTQVTITGTNLNAGSNVVVTFGKQPCLFHRYSPGGGRCGILSQQDLGMPKTVSFLNSTRKYFIHTEEAIPTVYATEISAWSWHPVETYGLPFSCLAQGTLSAHYAYPRVLEGTLWSQPLPRDHSSWLLRVGLCIAKKVVSERQTEE